MVLILRSSQEHATQYLTSTYVPKLVQKKVASVISHQIIFRQCMSAVQRAAVVPQISYKMKVVKFATDNDSIGSIICKRAEKINAVAVVLAKHNKGKIAEFFVGSVTNYCESHR